MKNEFTDYLQQHGWIENTPMSYNHPDVSFELFFDNSNIYLHNLTDLEKTIQELEPKNR